MAYNLLHFWEGRACIKHMAELGHFEEELLLRTLMVPMLSLYMLHNLHTSNRLIKVTEHMEDMEEYMEEYMEEHMEELMEEHMEEPMVLSTPSRSIMLNPSLIDMWHTKLIFPLLSQLLSSLQQLILARQLQKSLLKLS